VCSIAIAGSIPNNLLDCLSSHASAIDQGETASLILAGNRFTGPVPTLGSNTALNLSVLSLGMNYLTGSLPDEWASHLGSLDLVDLRSNQLEGELPDSWAATLLSFITDTTRPNPPATSNRQLTLLLANNTCLCGSLDTSIIAK
jgi:hypothetical protein